MKAWQFNCWNKNDPNFDYLSGTKPIPAGQFAQAQRAADQVIAGTTPDPTGGATHYYAITMKPAPDWARGAKQTLKLGRHVFLQVCLERHVFSHRGSLP